MKSVTSWPNYQEDDFVIDSFEFGSGQVLDQLRLRYFTMGSKQLDTDGQVTNAVLLLHNTTGSGQAWLALEMEQRLFSSGAPLDLKYFYCIVPDMIGFGGSSKPSDRMRAKFPNYRYIDMVRSTRQLLQAHLGIEHLRLILGLSMGGMLTWMWAGLYPNDMSALVPIACQPGPMSGRNWMQRRISIEAIRNDPEWRNGDYETNPSRYAFTAPLSALMTQSVLQIQGTAPTRRDADRYYGELVERARKGDANNRLYQLEASMDYDPSPLLDHIKAPVLAINFADDQLNPPELGVVEPVIERLPNAKYVLVPGSAETFGHRSALRPETMVPASGRLHAEALRATVWMRSCHCRSGVCPDLDRSRCEALAPPAQQIRVWH